MGENKDSLLYLFFEYETYFFPGWYKAFLWKDLQSI